MTTQELAHLAQASVKRRRGRAAQERRRAEIIAALAGEDLEHQAACRTCRGAGRIAVGAGRGDRLTCPACRGTGTGKAR